MSEDNSTETKKAREPKKNSIPLTEVRELVAGIPQYDKASFLVVGHKDGVRLAIPRTTGVSRTYFYGNNDYSTVPTHAAVKTFSADERKEQRLGGIMAEIDFSQGLDAAREALSLMVEAVRNAPTPAPKPKKEPKEKKAKAPAEAEASNSDAETTGGVLDDRSDDGDSAEA